MTTEDTTEAITVADYGFQDETTTTDADVADDCVDANLYLNYFRKIWFGYSVAVIIGFGFIIHRKGLCLKCCGGRPGFLQPIDFIEETGRRWAYAACFIIITYDVISLFFGYPFWFDFSDKSSEWSKKFGWVKVFTKLIEVLSVCLVHYPLFAFVNQRRTILANIFGVIHVIPWIVLYSQFFDFCRVADQKQKHGVLLYISRVPAYVSYFILIIAYVLDFALNVHRWRKQRRGERNSQNIRTEAIEKVFSENRRYKTGHHFEYVDNLLRRKNTEEAEEANTVKLKLMKVANRVKYEKVYGFRYSTRIICSIAVCTFVLVWFVVFTIDVIDWLVEDVISLCDAIRDELAGVQFMIDICEGLVALKVIMHFSSAFSAFLIFLMLIHTLITYKRRWHQMLRGDNSWHPFDNPSSSPDGTLLNGLKYGGYQVAFVLWGWVVLTFFLFVVVMFVGFAFVIPLKQRKINWFIQKLIDLWPSLLLGIIIIPLIQKLICKFVFLQERGAFFAITNRRIYNAASYYFFVLNIIVGIFSCVKRIVIPLVLGILFLSRLDQPLIMKGYESKDPGYAAFVSMLFVDVHHNHPVIKAFVELLVRVRNERKPNADVFDVESVVKQDKHLRSKRIRNRWMKIITLGNNPSLALKALEQRLIEDRDQRTKQTSQDTSKLEYDCNVDDNSVKKAFDETDSLKKEHLTMV